MSVCIREKVKYGTQCIYNCVVSFPGLRVCGMECGRTHTYRKDLGTRPVIITMATRCDSCLKHQALQGQSLSQHHLHEHLHTYMYYMYTYTCIICTCMYMNIYTHTCTTCTHTHALSVHACTCMHTCDLQCTCIEYNTRNTALTATQCQNVLNSECLGFENMGPHLVFSDVGTCDMQHCVQTAVVEGSTGYGHGACLLVTCQCVCVCV